MIKTLFTLTFTLLLMVTLCLTVSAQSWELSGTFSFPARGATENFEFSSKNVLFFTMGDTIYKWDISTGDYWWQSVGSVIYELDIPEENPFYVAYLKANKSVGMRYTSDLRWRGGFECKYAPNELAVSANGDSLVVGGGQYIETWDVRNPSASYEGHRYVGKHRSVWSLAMYDSGSHFFAADSDDNIDHFNFWSLRLDRVYNSGRVAAIKYSDGILAAWRRSGRIQIWEYDARGDRYRNTRNLWGSTDWWKDGSEEMLSFSANLSAPYIAAVDPVPAKIFIWNVKSGKLLDTIHAHVHNGIALNNDGTRLAAGTSGWGSIYIFHKVGAAAPAATPQAAPPPAVTTLLSNYPNPFNPETWIPYQLATPAEVTVSIHAADGKLVRTLALGQMPAGVYQDKERAAYWDGTNEQGEPAASGVYFYTLKAGDFSATKKMLIRK